MSCDRRTFLHRSLAGGLLGSSHVHALVDSGHARASQSPPATQADPIVGLLIRANDARVRELLPRQERQAGHRWLGGLADEYGIHSAGSAAQFIVTLACAYASRDSAFHQSPELAAALTLAAGALLRAQHEDGTIDLLATNFHSPPDTAFVLEPVTAAAAILRRGASEPTRLVGERLDTFMLNAGEALVTGGVHTPNHRWVVAAALARLHAWRPDPRYLTLPTDYARVFAFSNLARIRRGAASATILADNATVVSFRKGTAALEAVRIASAFFGKGQFVGDRLDADGSRYRMRQTLVGPYFQPLTASQIAAGDHVRLAPNGTLANDSRTLRAQSNVQRLESQVEVVEENGRLTIAITIDGTANVPVAVELAFRHGGRLEGVEPVASITDAFLLREGTGRYVFDNQTITFGPGRVEHRWTQLRGALPKWDGLSVYLTGFTPFMTTLAVG